VKTVTRTVRNRTSRSSRDTHRQRLLVSFGLALVMPLSFVGGMVTGEYVKSVAGIRIVTPDLQRMLPLRRSGQMQLQLSQETQIASIDTSHVRIQLARGWDVEQKAFADTSGLLFFSGPFFEEHPGTGYNANSIGDVYVDGQLSVASRKSAPFATRRYFMALRHDGRIEFGFGGWQSGYENRYSAFFGGLGYAYLPSGPDPDYLDPYSGVKQTLHNAIPRERLFVGKDREGRLLVMKTSPLPQLAVEMFVRQHGFDEAFFLDQGNKARFIVPGRLEDRPRYNLPYMLRMSDLDTPAIEYEAPPLDEYSLYARKRRRTAVATPSASASPGVKPGLVPVPRVTPGKTVDDPVVPVEPSFPPTEPSDGAALREPAVPDEPPVEGPDAPDLQNQTDILTEE
jgi:hypothetical protein